MLNYKQEFRFSNLKWVTGNDIILNGLTLVKVWENLLVQEITIEGELYIVHTCVHPYRHTQSYLLPVYNISLFVKCCESSCQPETCSDYRLTDEKWKVIINSQTLPQQTQVCAFASASNNSRVQRE